MKYLIINADDFGYSRIFNDAILRLSAKGFISSTTVMVNWVTARQVSQIKELEELAEAGKISVGLHLELTDDNFQEEIEKQFDKFNSLFGFPPSHIDIHKSMFLKEAFPVVIDFCREHDLPCRNHKIEMAGVVTTQNEVVSGTKLSFDELKKTIETFRDGESYEILFHPGTYDPDSKSSLNKERESDVQKIEDIQPFLAKNGIKLINFKDLIRW